MNLDQWLSQNEAIRTPHEFDFVLDMSFEKLIKKCGKYDVIILEGVRSCGKSFVRDRLQAGLNIPTYATWRSQGGLKKFYNNRTGAPDGAVRISPTLEVNQANTFVLEYLIQTRTRAIIDRGFFSSMHFQDIVPHDIWDIYCNMLRQVRSVILFIEPYCEESHKTTLAKRGITLESINHEYKRYLEIFKRLPYNLNFNRIKMEHVK